MKNVKVSAVLSFLLISLVLGQKANSADKVMRMAIQAPESHYIVESVLSFKEEVESNSRGAMKIEVHDYGFYINDKENRNRSIKKKILDSPLVFYRDGKIPDVVSKGTLEAGMFSLPRLSERIPLSDIFLQPFLFDSETKIKAATETGSVIRKSIDEAVRELGLTVLWWQPYGSVVFVSKGEAIHNPDDIKDKRVRVFSETLGNLALSAGAIPILISNSRQYFAYKHRKVEIGMTTISEINNKEIWEIMDTISLTNSASIHFLVVVNSRWWNMLDFRSKAIISNAAQNAQRKAFESLKKAESVAYKSAIENGMNLSVLSDDDKDYWKEKAEPIYEDFLEKSGAAGRILFDAATSQ